MQLLLAVLIAVSVLAGAGVGSATASVTQGATTEEAAKRAFLAHPRVAGWLSRYRGDPLLTLATLQPAQKQWDVGVFSGEAGQVAKGTVASSGEVLGVGRASGAWPLARGNGLGVAINRPLLWLLLCAFFLVGLANLRRPLCLRNLDLLAALSFSVPLALVNQGHVFASAIAASAVLAYLIVRCTWIGVTNRPRRPFPRSRSGCSSQGWCFWSFFASGSPPRPRTRSTSAMRA